MPSDSSSMHAADRLLNAIEKKRAPVCVGLDPVLERLSNELSGGESATERIAAFCDEVLEAIAEHVPCVKFQSACFERLGAEGCHILAGQVESAAYEHGLVVITDAKRGDIGVSADHYAQAYFGDDGDDLQWTNWLTINSYLGEDGITPFIKDQAHGAFALVRTSNPGGDEIQNLELKSGGTVSHAVAEMIARIGSKTIGERGYSNLGAVVGATKPQDAKRLREIMPQQMFLVPGFGAQGAGVDDVLPCFKSDGTGAIVTASRSVIYAFEQDDPNWQASVGDAAAKFAEEIGRAVGMR
jgi:orotidine-5'-phosphate decarboxylase